jgi:hypothetical protein
MPNNLPGTTSPAEWELLLEQPFRYRSGWQASNNYSINDIVFYDGSTWIAIAPSINIIPEVGNQWDIFAVKGTKGDKGDVGSTPIITIGTVTSSPTPTVTSEPTSNGIELSFGIPRGEKGDIGEPGFSPNRVSLNFTTPQINPGDTATLSINIAKNAQLLYLATNYASRVRIYQTSASATDDINRIPGIVPLPEILIFSEVITIPSKLSWGLYKPTFVFQELGISYPMLVTNNDSSPRIIEVSIDAFILIE